MDPSRFDHLTRLLSHAGGRRALLGSLLSAALGGAVADAAARKQGGKDKDKDKDRERDAGWDESRESGQPLQVERRGKGKGRKRKTSKKRGGGNDGGPTEPPPPECCGTESCPDPERGSTRSGCDFSGRSFAGQDINGSTLRGIDGRGANFNQTNNQGSVFAEACLQGASFRRARLDSSTWGEACLFGTDFTGADFGGDLTLFDEALFCDTVMPDGSVNDRDCANPTPCCQPSPNPGPACQRAADCADQPCQTKACQNGQCVYDEVFNGASPNTLCTFCCENQCCLAPANQCNSANSCCAPNCEGRVCGPDGCGGTGTCGPCSVQAGRRCTPAGQCVCDAISCPNGCCDANADCWPGDSNARCGPPGGTCATCTGQDVCRNRQCVCQPNCANRQCGSDGCGGSCGNCPSGQRCQNNRCVCDAVSCPDGCCSNGPGNPGVCRPGTAKGACGLGGSSCAACPQGQDCFDQQCAACGPRTCSDGCCAADGTCQSGFAITACGGPSGGPCASCSEEQTCQGRQCVDCGLECICTGQSICADPAAPNITCPGPSSGELGLCYVSQTGEPICGGGIVQIPSPGCTGDAECQEYGAGSVCVAGVNVPGQTQCSGDPFCVTPLCTPDCAGKVCGFDGCGGTCGGQCGPCERCENGRCQTLQPNGGGCGQDGDCCSGNCFADACSDRVTNCGRNVCNPPARGCLDDLCCNCASIQQCCGGGCCGDGEVCDDGTCSPR